MFDRKEFEKEFQKKHPISPKDEYIVMFDEGVSFQDVRKTLTDVFNKHGRGKMIAALPGGTTTLITNVNWDIVNELKENRSVRSIGPNRKVFGC